MIPSGSPDKTLNIDVFRYEDDYTTRLITTVQDAYAKRVATIMDQWIAETSNEGKSDGVTGSIRIFCNPSVGYLAVVRSSEFKSADTATLKAQLKTLLDTKMVPTGQTWIQTINTDKTLPIKVNERFKITITPTLAAQQVWRGYTVKGPRGHVLFLGAEQLADNTVQFNFLARSSGFEMITISMYDGNLEVDTRIINVWLQD